MNRFTVKIKEAFDEAINLKGSFATNSLKLNAPKKTEKNDQFRKSKQSRKIYGQCERDETLELKYT